VCLERPYSSRTSPTSTTPSTVNPKNDRANELKLHHALESSIITSLKLKGKAPNLNLLQKIKQSHSTLTLSDVSPRKSSGETTEEE
jgi:hypothetical protein